MHPKNLATGITGLDDVLNGGYLKNAPTLIKGGPGTGKTIFMLFFAYTQIQDNKNVIFVTCEELPTRIISHMDGFGLKGSQFQAEGNLGILDLTPQFDDEFVGDFTMDALLLRVMQASKQNNATILIIDSLQSLLLSISQYDPYRELLKLFQWCRDKKLTVLMTLADNQKLLRSEVYEEYIVDCAIELKQCIDNSLMTRYLRVIKMRGTPHGTNEYPFTIFHRGISLLPITQTRLEENYHKEYIKSGIIGLDEMLNNKGYQIGSTIMISGRSGTAKSIFAASFALSAVKEKKKVLFISFEESPGDLVNHLKSINLDLEPYIKNQSLKIESRRSVEMGIEDHIISIIEIADRKNLDVLILDPISSLLDIGNIRDIKMLFIRFINYMKAKGRTLLFTELLPDYSNVSTLGLSSLTDTWLRLSYAENNGEFNRLIYIAKSRGVKTSNQLKEFLLTDTGVYIQEPYLGDDDMTFGSKKFALIIRDQQEQEERLERITQIDTELKGLEEELMALEHTQKLHFLAKKNNLVNQKKQLIKEAEQIRSRLKANKVLRK